MANSNDKQRPRPASSAKHSTLQIHISTRACLALGGLLLLLSCLVIFAMGRGFSRAEAKPGLSGYSGSVTSKNSALPTTPEGWTSCAPGPWGSLAFVRMSIEIPDEYISAHLHETAPSRWSFNHYTPEKLTDLLGSVELSADARTELLDRSKWTISPGGISIAPSSQIVLSLSKAARSTIYGVLAEYAENVAQDQPYIFAPGSFEKRFADSGLADATISLVQRLCYPHGSLQLFADLPAALQMLPSYEEKLRLEKALSRRETMLVKLSVGPNTDVETLVKYWGRAGSGRDLRPMLESLSRVPGGTRITVVHLLPPWPAARLYSFPYPSEGRPEDCHWTSFNFFKDPPEPIPNDGQFLRKKLDTEYYPVSSDPRYGDLVLLATRAGPIIHSCVYLADNIVYTKNGANHTSAWLLSTIAEVTNFYSAYIPTNESLKILYYRNKYY